REATALPIDKAFARNSDRAERAAPQVCSERTLLSEERLGRALDLANDAALFILADITGLRALQEDARRPAPDVVIDEIARADDTRHAAEVPPLRLAPV